MDLDYQSQPNVDITKQLNRIDKLTSKLALTLKDIPPQQIIPQKTKDQIVTHITNDQVRPLIRTLDKQVITWDRQLGAKGTRWNAIHLCAKFNAVNSVRVLLKQMYQREPEQYINGVNSETAEGFTPLMISIIYKGDRVLELLLQLGGVDLSKIQRGKLRAYDLALHYRNQFAISQLIVYQDRCRKRQYINQEELLKTEPLLEEKPTVWDSMTSYMLDCLLCFKYQDDSDDKLFTKMNPFKRDSNEDIDAVKVGSRRDIQDYQIEWRKLSSIQGQKIALFDSFKPQDICQSQFSLKNNLILLQTLSDFPWLLRKVITRVETGQGHPLKYNVNLYPNCIASKIVVDQCVPIVKERGEPMFLTNRSEIWPMILQKSMAKVHGSYLALNTLSPAQALETITGFYVKQVPLNNIADSHGFIPSLQDLANRGYLVLLQGRPRTQLNSGSDVNSYSILNYFQKGSTRKILISCPNLVENWNQTRQIRQLTILKAHFSRINQSCIWIDQSKLDYFFTHATIVFLKEGSLRNDLNLKLKIRRESEASLNKIAEKEQTGEQKVVEQTSAAKEYSKSIFFKFKVDRRKDQPILLQITDLQTRDRFDLSQLVGWRDEGHGTITKEDEHPCCPELVRLLSIPGQYLCKFELKARKITPKRNLSDPTKSIIKRKDHEQDCSECRKKVQLNLGPEHLQEIQLTTWSPEPLQLQLLEEQFGTIQWLAHFKNFVNIHWDQLTSANQPFLTETANKKTIVIAKRIPRKRLMLNIGSAYSQNFMVEGKWSDELGEGRVQLISDGEEKCAYCVLTGMEAEALQEAKLLVVNTE